MAKGGKRPGAGNVSTLNGWSRKLGDYFTPEEVIAFMDDLKDRAKKDSKIAIWVADHIFGKAPQPIEGTGEKGEIILKWIK